MARVLIVEDEAVLRSAMARGIAKMPGITVAEAATLSAALESIDAQAPQMIVSDIDLPDRPGLELLGELGRRGLHVPILFVSAYLKAYAPQIPPHADVDVREKPVPLDELRALIEGRLAASAATAEEAPFAPADYLQLACLGHRSVVIEVETPEEKGLIAVHDGILWTATDEHGAGVAAFRRLAFRDSAVVRVRGMRDAPGPRTIYEGWESVLMDAAREHDESSRGGRDLEDALAALDIDSTRTTTPAVRIPAPPAPFDADVTLPSGISPSTRAAQVPPPRAVAPTLPSMTSDFDAPPAEEPADPATLAFEDAFDAGVDALLVKDYATAYAAFERAAAIRPDDPKVVTNLERLRQLGHGPSRSSG